MHTALLFPALARSQTACTIPMATRLPSTPRLLLPKVPLSDPTFPFSQANILKVVQHWYRMRNLTPPSQLVGVTLPQPEF